MNMHVTVTVRDGDGRAAVASSPKTITVEASSVQEAARKLLERVSRPARPKDR
tara:strand:+ start:561 stop:719 length:159 start_codon:yes stop_codon:yes gene_type:complete